MRIGSEESFLRLEKVGREGPAVVWEVTAAIHGAGCIAAVHGLTKVRTTDGDLDRMDDFAAHQARQFELKLSQGGWLRIRRDPKGRTLVNYRLGHLRKGAALEGKVRLEGESAKAFCRELEELL